MAPTAPNDSLAQGAGSARDGLRSPRELIEAAIQEEVEAMGYEVVTVEWAGAPRHRVVRVYIDRPGGGLDRHEGGEADAEASEVPESEPQGPRGISLDEIIKMSPIVSAALDAAEADPDAEALRALLKSGYTLECSSPGIERPLAKRAHFEAQLGRRIKVRTFEPIEPGSKQRNFHGYVDGCEVEPALADDPYAGELLLREADGDGVYRIPLPAMKRAHLVYEEPKA